MTAGYPSSSERALSDLAHRVTLASDAVNELEARVDQLLDDLDDAVKAHLEDQATIALLNKANDRQVEIIREDKRTIAGLRSDIAALDARVDFWKAKALNLRDPLSAAVEPHPAAAPVADDGPAEGSPPVPSAGPTTYPCCTHCLAVCDLATIGHPYECADGCNDDGDPTAT